MNFDGILFFPVTPFDTAGRVDDDLLRTHVGTTIAHAPGGVFPACGTGEFHALSTDEVAQVVRVATETVAGRVPVVAGTGGPLGQAVTLARAAADAGADALL
ncbi:dihydrodipicolinate synthase family protein, partial [Microbacterium sp. CPCC 204701]|uniref:dihydrodipicolinate synthase family protein n=1 Tax=Microbacterium sp. CPCC 204701 TaxID=2493084 RepID=UPI00197B2078